MSARYRKDEQAPVQWTRRRARSPRSALGTARRGAEERFHGDVLADRPVEEGGRRSCINSAALRFVPYEGLQAEGYGACRELRNQAVTIEGAKR